MEVSKSAVHSYFVHYKEDYYSHVYFKVLILIHSLITPNFFQTYEDLVPNKINMGYIICNETYFVALWDLYN